MSQATGIEWTDATWNCLAGCEAVSPGCANCYAATMTRRLEAMGQKDYAGLTTAKHFNGVVRCLPDKLDIPLRRKKPTMYFVNSMSDLFHEDVPDEFIDKVFAVMALCPQHMFQVLTKRAERMRDYMRRATDNIAGPFAGGHIPTDLPNVWLGVSVEDQQRADERIPHLLNTPAAIRFLSCEPLLGPVDLTRLRPKGLTWQDCLSGRAHAGLGVWTGEPKVDWLIVGGESGPNARPCDVSSIRSLLQQGRAAGIPVFVKQLGPRPYDGNQLLGGSMCWRGMRDSKGGDPDEWPADLRVREMPRR